MLAAIGRIATTICHPVAGWSRTPPQWSIRVRVNGFGGLRVDASIMPRIVSGNTASPVVVIAEMAADRIREDG